MKRIATLVLVALSFGIAMPVFSAALDAPAQAREAAVATQHTFIAQADEPVEQPNPAPTPPGDDINPDQSPNQPTDPNQETPNVEPNAQDTCRNQLGGLSWILCPIFELAVEGAELLGDWLIGLLEFDPVITDVTEQGPTSSALYEAWGIFRDIANLLLVVAFIFIIYLVMTGSQAYAVQRMLPRLVIATIGIQLSFVISALMVDVGNVLGAGIAELFSEINQRVIDSIDFASLDNQLFSGSQFEATLNEKLAYGGSSVTAIIAVPVAFLLLILFIFSAAFPPFLVVFISGLIGLFVALVILGLRQIAIVVLIVTSPLSFLLAIFPGTQNIFKEWSDNLIKLILIYPLVVLLFSVSGLLSSLALLASGQRQLGQFMATLLPVVTLFAVPYLFRFAGRIFRGAGGLIQGGGKSMTQSLLGDYNDPGSMRSQARLRSLKSRLDRSKLQNSKFAPLRALGRFSSQKGIADEMANHKATKGRRLWGINPVKTQSMYYALGGSAVEGQFTQSNPENLKRLWQGEEQFRSDDSTEDYDMGLLQNTNWALGEINNFRRNPAFMAATAEQMVGYVGSSHDRGYNVLNGLGRMVNTGKISHESAEVAFTEFQNGVKGMQRQLGVYDFDDVVAATANETNTKNARQVKNYLFSNDPNRFDGLSSEEASRRRANEIKKRKKLIGIGSGTLTESQGEGSWRAMQKSIVDPDIQLAATPGSASYDSAHRRSLESVLQKGYGMKQQIRQVRTQEQVDPETSDEQIMSTFFNKSGNEIEGIRQFLGSVDDVAKAIDFDHTTVSDRDEPAEDYTPRINPPKPPTSS